MKSPLFAHPARTLVLSSTVLTMLVGTLIISTPASADGWLTPEAQASADTAVSTPRTSSATPFGGSATAAARGESVPFSIEGTSGTVSLQRQAGNAWKTVASYRPVVGNGWRQVNLRVPAAVLSSLAGQRPVFRVSAAASTGLRAWTSTPQTLVVPKRKTSITASTLPSQSKSVQSARASVTAQATVSNASGRTLSLQKYSSGAWRTVASAKVVGTRATVRMPLPQAARATTQFRWSITASTSAASAATSSSRVTSENPSKYTGYRGILHRAIRAHCPTTIIEVHKPQNRYAGLAYLGSNRIAIVSGLSGSFRTLAAVHECAHLKQWDVVQRTGSTWNTLKTRLNRIYGTKGDLGLEMNATCTAHSMGAPLVKGAGYTSNCTGARGKAGAAIKVGRLP